MPGKGFIRKEAWRRGLRRSKVPSGRLQRFVRSLTPRGQLLKAGSKVIQAYSEDELLLNSAHLAGGLLGARLGARRIGPREYRVLQDLALNHGVDDPHLMVDAVEEAIHHLSLPDDAARKILEKGRRTWSEVTNGIRERHSADRLFFPRSMRELAEEELAGFHGLVLDLYDSCRADLPDNNVRGIMERAQEKRLRSPWAISRFAGKLSKEMRWQREHEREGTPRPER